MRNSLCAVICTLAALFITTALPAADMTWTFAVQASATINAAPARIELHWTTDPFPVKDYVVARKGMGENAWGAGVPLPADATGFTDENVEVGRVYEYQIIRHAVAYTSYGYICVGINAPLVDTRGKVVLVVDSSIASPLTAELKRLQMDLAGDGWTVVRKDVARDAAPADVKSLIHAEWDADREHTKAVFLFGHVPVARSGNLNVDGHAARPMPADVFYGEMDGAWTDANGDGILDQSTIPSDVELEVGRVDFANLSGKDSGVNYPSEVDLLRRYLDKDNAFRHALTRPAARALVGNSVGDGGGQAYAASGYRNFAALIGAENVTTTSTELNSGEDQRWIARLAADDYLWAYGCGAGSDFTVGSLGLHGAYNDLWASDFIDKKAKGTFYMMFGSWFAEWDKPDNLLRTTLAAPQYGLAASWSGRPHLFYHHMGIGETIGYGIRLSQNNSGLYQNQVQRQLRGIHISLMGDPTLRLHQLAGPTDVKVALEGDNAVLTWKPSSDVVLGYHVYRGASVSGPFARISDDVVGDPRFVDSHRTADAPFYQVRAITLQVSPSGSYYNASQGAFAALPGANLDESEPPASP